MEPRLVSEGLQIAFGRLDEETAVLRLQNLSTTNIAYKATVTYVGIQRFSKIQQPAGFVAPHQTTEMQMSVQSVHESLRQNSQSYVLIVWSHQPRDLAKKSASLAISGNSQRVRVPFSLLFTSAVGEVVVVTANFEVRPEVVTPRISRQNGSVFHLTPCFSSDVTLSSY